MAPLFVASVLIRIGFRTVAARPKSPFSAAMALPKNTS